MYNLIKILVFSFLTLILNFCKERDYKYQISGWVNTKVGLKYAIWNTDSITFDRDTLFYKNTDGSVVRIHPPYIIKQNK